MPGERTEQATQHRREKARREGDILRSRELSAAAGTLAGVMVLGVMGGRFIEAWRGAYAAFLDLGAPVRWEPSDLMPGSLYFQCITFSEQAEWYTVPAERLVEGCPTWLGKEWSHGGCGFQEADDGADWAPGGWSGDRERGTGRVYAIVAGVTYDPEHQRPESRCEG